MTHYHICWSSCNVDWEVYRSRVEAETGAHQLVRPGETYTMKEFDQSCPTCRRNMLSPKSAQVIKFRERKAS